MMSEGTSVDSMTFEDYNLAKNWADVHNLVQTGE